jgi:hypothetical protein
MSKYIVPLTVTFGLIIIGGALMFYYWLVPKIRDGVKLVNQNMTDHYAETTERFKDQYRLDHKEIKKLNIFANDYDRSGADAAEFLNPEIEKIIQGRGKTEEERQKSFLVIPRNLANALIIESNEWMSLKVANQIGDVSTDWLKELKGFNYWSEEKGRSFEEILSKDQLHDFFEKPVETPYLTFYYWAQIAWLKFLFKNGFNPRENLRQLARLLHSQGTLQATLMAIKILEVEVEVGDYYPEKLKTIKLSQADIGRLKRFSVATSGLLRTAMFAPKNYELYDELEFGRCMAVEGSMPHFFMLYKPLFNQPWGPHYLRMSDYIKNERCSRDRFKAVWGNDKFTIKHMKGKEISTKIEKDFLINDKSKDYAFQSTVNMDIKGKDIFELASVKIIAKVFSSSLLALKSPDPWELYR